MKGVERILVLIFLMSNLVSCSQTKNGIKKIYAFKTVTSPGAMAVDEEGRPRSNARDTMHIIYIETGKKTPVWKNAWVNGKTYNVSMVQVDGQSVTLGRTEKLTISAGKGSTLWQLLLAPSDKQLKIPIIAGPGEIIVQGLWDKKKFTRRISDIRELTLEENQ